jgi:N-acetyl-gamma-glutamyl-phosphate reductase common form
MDVKKIGLLGGRGYVGQEIFELVNNHPKLSITSVYSSSQAGQSVPGSPKDNPLSYLSMDLTNLELSNEDAYVLALPNDQSNSYVDKILEHNPEAILLDISSDHRFNAAWEYRLPELSEPVSSTKISNPGCYATAMQLMLAPLIDKISGPVNFFGISGYSGAGASPNPRNDKELLSNNILAYSMINHLHEQEVKHQMYKEIFFTPHVAEFFRGIHMTGNIILTDSMSADDAERAFQDFYTDNSLIQVQHPAPDLQQVRGTSFAVIGGFDADIKSKRLTFCCTIDNLLKGAATQALQNLNSAFGWDDNLGIIE